MPRVAFDFSEQALEEALKLQQAAEADCLGTVVQTALSLYKAIQMAIDAGYDVGVIKDGRIVKTVQLP